MQAFDRTLEQYSNQFGAMERIFKTPLPLVYVSLYLKASTLLYT